MRSSEQKVVYFVRKGSSGPVKIGKTTSMKSRLSQLKTASDEPLEVLATINGYTNEEKELHSKFSHIRLEGEWFKSEPSLLQFIDGIRYSVGTGTCSESERSRILRERAEAYEHEKKMLEHERSIERAGVWTTPLDPDYMNSWRKIVELVRESAPALASMLEFVHVLGCDSSGVLAGALPGTLEATCFRDNSLPKISSAIHKILGFGARMDSRFLIISDGPIWGYTLEELHADISKHRVSGPGCGDKPNALDTLLGGPL
jgi:hypothetical protein